MALLVRADRGHVDEDLHVFADHSV